MYEYTTDLSVEFGPLHVHETLKVEYEVTFGAPARVRYDENDHPAEPDEIQINSVKRLRMTLTGPSKWDDIYGPGTARGLLQDLVDTLLDDSAVREDLIDHARAAEADKEMDRADYEYDAYRDRELERG